MALFRALRKALGDRPVIAEDLGYLTDSVRKLVADCGFPGMKVLEFAFDSRDSSGANDYLPHNYPVNCVVYTGTHDNETAAGWYESILPQERAAVCRYLHRAPGRHRAAGPRPCLHGDGLGGPVVRHSAAGLARAGQPRAHQPPVHPGRQLALARDG